MKPPSSTKLLISVRSAAEAAIALEAGADIIDVKEPARGSLGAADVEVVDAIVRAVAARTAVSVALGELVDFDAPPALPAGVTYAKMGLHGAGRTAWASGLARCFASLPGIVPIAAAYVDHATVDVMTPSPMEVLDWAARHGAAGMLLDTFDKRGGDLLHHGGLPRLRKLIGAAHDAGLLVALAGSLTLESIPTVMAAAPDIIAVRGAACAGGDRTGGISGTRIAALRRVIGAPAAPPRPPCPTPATCPAC
jgi:uncharacterized protein (UPF0264 family)